MEEQKITIIEGPTPTFEIVQDSWANGIADGANQAAVAVTQLRTANGPALVERCYRAWNKRNPINLEFRSTDGMTQELSIVAAHAAESDEGDLLMLWVRLPENNLVVDFISGDDDLGDDYDDLDDLEGDDDLDIPF